MPPLSVPRRLPVLSQGGGPQRPALRCRGHREWSRSRWAMPVRVYGCSATSPRGFTGGSSIRVSHIRLSFSLRSGQNTPYHISRFLKGGYRSKGRNKPQTPKTPGCLLPGSCTQPRGAISTSNLRGDHSLTVFSCRPLALCCVSQDSWEYVSRLTSRSGSNEGAPPGSYALKTHRKALTKFLNR